MVFVPAFTLTPRLLLSLRKLYARDLQGRCGSDIDTAFGFTSTSGYGTSESGIVFAEGVQNEGEGQGEKMEMEIEDDRVMRSAANVGSCA